MMTLLSALVLFANSICGGAGYCTLKLDEALWTTESEPPLERPMTWSYLSVWPPPTIQSDADEGYLGVPCRGPRKGAQGYTPTWANLNSPSAAKQGSRLMGSC
jgi:hypothetical protein